MPIAVEPGLHPGAPIGLGWLALGLILLLAVAALTHQGDRAWSAALVYVGVGLVSASVIDALGIAWFDPVDQAQAVLRVTELTIAVALFANGIRLDRDITWEGWRAPVRLLAVAMPLTIGAVALVGVWGLGLGTAAAIVLGAPIAPTDPVLAGDVGVTKPGEEEPDEEAAITGEASLNDGLAFPFVMLGLVGAAEGWGAASLLEWAAVDLVARVVLGVAAGVAVGWATGRLLPDLRRRGHVSKGFDGIFTIGLAMACYGAGELTGGYAFLAAFAGGVAFRRVEREHETHGEVDEGATRVERLLEVSVLLLVFSSVTLTGLGEPGVVGWVLAFGIVLVIRPLLAYVSLLRAPPEGRRSRFFVAWFGVRGLGSLFYAAAAIESGLLPAAEAELIWWTAVATVLVSIVVHGISSGPLTRGLRPAESG
jgi:sodium/hydrogen antiporter